MTWLQEQDGDIDPAEFGDIDPDDAYAPGDEDVDWSQVEELADQIFGILSIEDEDERLEAAKKWADELNGE